MLQPQPVVCLGFLPPPGHGLELLSHLRAPPTQKNRGVVYFQYTQGWGVSVVQPA